MKKVTLMLLSIILVSAVFSQINAQVLFNENFNYPVGTKLVDTGYVNNSGTGTIQTVVTGNLTYTGYPASNIGGMIAVAGGSGSREDVYRSFEKMSTGALYTSFLIKVDTASKGDYFFHYFYKNGSTSAYNARTYVKGNGDGTFKFGISKAKTDTVYTTTNYKYGTTYLVVIKYEYLTTQSANDDKVSLFVNPDLTAAEPTANIFAVDASTTSSTDSPLNAIGIRQGSDVYTLNMDGIVVATTWDKLNSAPVAPVVFQANMRVQILEKKFTVGTDKVILRGDFQTAAGDAGNWSGAKFELQDPDKDSIYTLTVDFPAAKVDTPYSYKLVIAPEGYEAGSNRPFAPKLPVNILVPAYFSNDTVVNLPSPNVGKKFSVKFSADISSILGSGVGFFDPSSPRNDSLTVQGLDWDGLGKDVKGSRKMSESLTPGIYETTLSFTAMSDSVKWKFRAFPENHFGDNGWEDSKDRWIVFGKDTAITIPTITPKIAPAQPAITKDMKVLFQVNMTGAVNSYDNTAIPKADIYFVGVKGADSLIGAWGGSWVVADTGTTPKTMLVLNDSGVLGDKVAGDNIWSREVTFKSGTAGGTKQFKYGCWYKGAETHTTATAVLDNESAFQTNHSFMLKDETSGRIELKANFGSMTTGVKELKDSKIPTVYSLTQNYPNPFNPSTSIRYAVPQAGMVTLKIFNMLGQEVATLVHAQQNAGSYEVSFDASRLSSGIYLYNLTSGAFSSTKKMMLVK